MKYVLTPVSYTHLDVYKRQEYQSALRRFNNRLKDLARALRLKSPVTSYTLRHSWATTAKYRGVSIEMISESLGHKSIKTTQIYLKGFGLKERTEVNKGNLSYVRNCCVAVSYTHLRCVVSGCGITDGFYPPFYTR